MLSTPIPLSLVAATVIVPPFGIVPSATTTILNSFPFFLLSSTFFTALCISYGISGIKAISAPPAIADSKAIHPSIPSHNF